jgi:TPR repeat protein
MYDNGTGVPEDDTEAVKWYRLAADQGDADAKARLKELAPQVSKSTKPPPVTSFAGKLPWDLVNGYSFATHPKVVAALRQAVGDEKIVNALLSGNVVANPISEPSGSSGVMVYQACEPQNCADNNWRILYYASSGNAEVCLSNRDEPYSFRGWMPAIEQLEAEEDCFS